MPELPEVQTVINSLRKLVLGQKIKRFVVQPTGLKSLGGLGPQDFSKNIVGQSIAEISRKGKFLVFELKPSGLIIAHLRMTGRFVYLPKDEKKAEAKVMPQFLVSDNSEIISLPEKYVRLSIGLTHGDLYFADKRRFGTFHYTMSSKDYFADKTLGPDALEAAFNDDYLTKKLCKTRKPIYSSLLEQGVVAGLGNIYVCESLALTRISPWRQSNRLTKKETETLVGNIKEVLKRALEAKGTSFSDYVDGEGKRGEFKQQLLVYSKKTARVGKNEYLVATGKIGGRTVWYIAEIQK